ncbi:uncharacterized protein BO88DRAFT_345484 [Aspergillus vadensis CBS 113365]|uniref:Uncharacterized protein n=1 Tax=Aspergillus vadensis (strain CBS 113365 / IMI 142717 / IBT 24658) TaxID=1448311 RepID=A0A319B8Y2_ASPVC|nr:hypothetical protein BO88DRAFT_345484 [Aspergillus vadensis CBS 113365]PYH66860.1 hypothetical protein BO88DRAFT_345484 [Aspergillus vadensis CBS 113365]
MSSSIILPASATLAMTKLYPPRTFNSLDDCKTEISALWARLRERDVNQVLSYKHVRPSAFVYLEKHRCQLGTSVRFTYHEDIETLLIKIPLEPHEGAQRSIAEDTATMLSNMGVERDERWPTGAATYKISPTSESAKEGDSTYRNRILRPNEGDWPHWAIESGVSESLPHLRMAVDWWIGKSRGRIGLVLLLDISRARKLITIEKYVAYARQGPRTRAQAAGAVHVRRCVSTIVVNLKANPPSVQGAPLILEFKKIVGRPAVNQERDVVFDSAALLAIARGVFRGMS